MATNEAQQVYDQYINAIADFAATRGITDDAHAAGAWCGKASTSDYEALRAAARKLELQFQSLTEITIGMDLDRAERHVLAVLIRRDVGKAMRDKALSRV